MNVSWCTMLKPYLLDYTTPSSSNFEKTEFSHLICILNGQKYPVKLDSEFEIKEIQQMVKKIDMHN